MVGPFSDKVNKHMEADVGTANSVVSIMKEKRKELKFLGNPTYGPGTVLGGSVSITLWQP